MKPNFLISLSGRISCFLSTQQEQVEKKDCVKSLSGREQRAELFLKKKHGKYLIYA